MLSFEFPPPIQAIIHSYDPTSGCYRNPDGSLDPCHTEIETLETWRGLLKCLKPKVVVETGVYHGLSTCFIAAALIESGVKGAKVHSIDPLKVRHLWEGSVLSDFINYIPKTTQEAVLELKGMDIDVLFIDSIHTYAQAGWELITLEPQLREGGYIIMHDSLFFDGVGRAAQHLYDNARFEVITFDTPRTQAAQNVDAGRVSMGCTIARKICHGDPIEIDEGWLGLAETAPAGPDAHLRVRARLAARLGG